MMPIVYTKWNLANRFNDCIELNENLKKYPKLHAAILHHEIEHTNKPFSVRDVKNDLAPLKKINQMDVVRFMLKNPKSFTQLLPFYYTKKRGFIYDLNMIVTYSVLILIVGSAVVLGNVFN